MTPVIPHLTASHPSNMTYLAIALGGALGSILRYALSTSIDTRWGEGFPWGTLSVNLLGCFVIGVLAYLSGSDGRLWGSPETRQFLITGLCGGFTTFSTFGLQTLNLLRDGDCLQASAYVIGSVVICLIGVWLGHGAAELMNQP